MGAAAIQDHRARLAAGESGDAAAPAHLLGSLIEAVGLVKGGDLHLVGKQNVHMAIHQLLEAVAVTLHAKGIREAQRHFGTMGPGHLGRGNEGTLGLIAIPEITLQIEHLGLGHHLQIKITGVKAHRSAQIRAHRALSIWGNEDQATGG